MESRGQVNLNINDGVYSSFFFLIVLWWGLQLLTKGTNLLLAAAFTVHTFLLFLFCDVAPWIHKWKTSGHHKPAAGCSFYHSTCYLFYNVAQLHESHERWPIAITSLVLAAAFTVLLVIYSMLWLL
jgi:hypothetical protein